MDSLLWGFLGGVMAWLVTTFFAQPLRQFLELRSRVAEILATYEEDPRATYNPDADPSDEHWLSKRREAYDGIGSSLIGFDTANYYFVRLLRWKRLGKLRCYPKSAGLSLRLLGAAKPGFQAADEAIKSVYSGLKIRVWPYK